MSVDKSYIEGFVKRAHEYGFSLEESLELLKAANEPTDKKHKKHIKQKVLRKFKYWKNKLKTKGVFAGTYHKRVAIPKKSIDEDELKTIGFEPSLIAIPESGQDRFESFRHPENLLHLHSHGDHWTMHEDAHPSLSMALRGASLPEIPKAIVSGLSHVTTEGVPGAYKYIANRLAGGEDMLNAVIREAKGNLK